MPRYPSNRLESKVSKESLVAEALRDRPVVARNYYDQRAMIALLQRFQAAEEWARGLNASPEVAMLVAASLESSDVGYVFEDLATACHEAAPPRQPTAPQEEKRQLPDERAKAWLSPPVSRHASLDRLMHAMLFLGEHVAGSWTWVPAGSAVSLGGIVDDPMPLELEYSPPTDDVVELIESLRLTRDKEESWAHFIDGAARAYRKLRRLAGSAVADASGHLSSDPVLGSRGGTSAAEEVLGEKARGAHERLLAVIAEVGMGVEGDSELAVIWWREKHHQLMDAIETWMADVPGSLDVGNVGRQAIRKKVRGWVGYVLQYACLLTGNAAAFELVRMTKYLVGIHEKMRALLDSEGVIAPRLQETCDEVRAAYCRALVSSAVEGRWRQRLGDKAEGVGRMIKEIIGQRGQDKPLLKQSLVAAAERAGLLTATTKKSQEDAVEALLVQMQGCGLAARVPVTAFRRIDSTTPRNNTNSRRSAHSARHWWLNPLGTVLALPAR